MAQQITDGAFSDFYTSMGNQYTMGGLLTVKNTDYAAMYRANWVAGKVIDAVAEDMTSQGVRLTGLDQAVADTVQKALTKKQVWADVTDAVRWSRLFGGAIAVIEIVGQDAATPLDLKAIKSNTFSSLKVYDRNSVKISKEVIAEGRDVGLPTAYSITKDDWVHHTRVIRFVGTNLPPSMAAQEDYWGDSVLSRIVPEIDALAKLFKAIQLLTDKARLSIRKVDGLHQAIQANQGQWILDEAAMVNNLQGLTNTTVIDSKDSMEALTYNFQGLPELVIKHTEQVSGACEIPVTRLYGQSPSGFNSGASDLTMYYDRINSLQESDLREGLERIIQVILLSDAQVADQFTMEFVPLNKPNELEQATIAQNNTNTILSAYGAGLIDDVEAKQELMSQARFGVFTSITVESLADTEQHSKITATLDSERTS
jgi:phage-related protein (TIGR01555 family)